MEKIWLKEYPKGIPAEIQYDEYASLRDIMEASFSRFADLPAFSNMGKTLTYGELNHLSQAFAAFLQSRGLGKGDRIAIMTPNLLQYPVAAFGALRAGLVVVNVNPLYTARELEHQLRDSGAAAIVILENFAHILQQIIGKVALKTIITTQIGDMLPAGKNLLVNFVVKRLKKMVPPWDLPAAVSFPQALRAGKNRALDLVDLGLSDTAFLQYTGGTTGVAKGAVLSHGNMVANLQQVSAWLSTHTEEGKEIVITALPLYHIFSLTANCLVFMKLGGENILITNPRDMPGFVKELKKQKFTAITGVNTLFNGLLNTPGFMDVDFSHLKIAIGGGMAVQRRVAEQWREITGVALVEGYGLTETSPVACANPLDLKEYNGSIGLPVPSTEVAIRGDDGAFLPVGETGELCIRGPQVMQGYWQKPEETAKVLDKQGWLCTGDIAVMDEKGYVRIVDRKKDMILVSGFNVYPNEIEDVAAMHPDVMEVAAIGVPDERTGEQVKLFIVRKNPGLDSDSIIAHCRNHLTGYKIPRQIEFRDELPKTNVGKILRRELRER